VIAVDTNILVYAHRQDSPFHQAASQRVAELAEGKASWAIPWPCLHEFLAVVTHPRIYAPPTPLARALDQVDAWLESPTLAVLAESTTHWPTLRALLAAGRVAGAHSWPPVVSPARRSMTRGSRRCAASTACASCGRPTATSAASPGSRW